MKKILLAVGGTGGHIYPGLAVADELLARGENYSCSFIIDKKPIASAILKKRGYAAYRIDAAPFPRNKFWQICKFLYKSFTGFIMTFILLKRTKPDAVLAFGAYISVPAVFAAYFLKIPVILHEQNYFPGMANRFLSFAASKIAVSYEASKNYFPPEKTAVTGNPVRKELFGVSREDALKFFGFDDNRKTILVFGGSQGARSINHAIYSLIPYLESLSDEIQIIHLFGEKPPKRILNEYRKYELKVATYNYLNRMEYAYKLADIIIARAGATTIAEISALAIPSIFIPYPHAAAGHQYFNARAICEKGLAITYPDEKLSGAGLAVRLVPLLEDGDQLKNMSISFKKYTDGLQRADAELADLVENSLNFKPR